MSKKKKPSIEQLDELDQMSETACEDGEAIFDAIFGSDPAEGEEDQFLMARLKLIREKSNFFSLLHFAQIVMSNEASQRTFRGHEKRRTAKDFVQREWRAHRADYSENKSEFARHYARRVQNEMGVRVTDKTIREVWLRETT